MLLLCCWGCPCLSTWAPHQTQPFVPPVASIPPLGATTVPCPHCPSHSPLLPLCYSCWDRLAFPPTHWLNLSSSRAYFLYKYSQHYDLNMLLVFRSCSLKPWQFKNCHVSKVRWITPKTLNAQSNRLRPLWEFQKSLGILSGQSGTQQIFGEKHGAFVMMLCCIWAGSKLFFEGFDSRPGCFWSINI